MNYAKCPHCNKMVLEDKTADVKSEDGRIIRCIVGSCPDCKREFRWLEFYDYVEASDLVEIKK